MLLCNYSIDLKILPVYKALNGLGPKCISDLLEASRPEVILERFSVPRIKTKQGEAMFSVSASGLWNKLPEDLRSAKFVAHLNQGLKHYCLLPLILLVFCLFCFYYY